MYMFFVDDIYFADFVRSQSADRAGAARGWCAPQSIRQRGDVDYKTT